MFVVMALAMTLLEYIVGLVSFKGFHLRLWDYSKLWGNIQGIICPLFTFFWGVLSLGYYFLIDKTVYDAIDVQKLWHKMQSRGGFFRFVSIKPLTERIDAFDEFLHRRPGGANTADKP